MDVSALNARWIPFAIAPVIASLLVAGCGEPTPATTHPSSTETARGPVGGPVPAGPPSADPARALVGANEAVVVLRNLEDVFLLTGELKAVHSDDLLTPRTETWQVPIKWLAEDGLEVNEGDRLVEFDNSGVLSTIEEKRLEDLQTRIDLETKQAVLDADRHDRTLALARARHAEEKARLRASVPEELSKKKDWLEGRAVLDRAEADVSKAEQALEAFEISSKADLEVLRIAHEKAAREIAEGERTLDSLILKAPRVGIFIAGDNWRERRKFQIGDTCWPGMAVGTIPDLSKMEVDAWLSDVDDGRVKPGMKARCYLDTYPERSFPGMVEEVSSIAGENGFRVRISLSEGDASIMRPGMSVRTEVIRGKWIAALTVPREAVLREGTKTLVRRAGAGSSVEVEMAACTPTECVVRSGLSEGDHVVIR